MMIKIFGKELLDEEIAVGMARALVWLPFSLWWTPLSMISTGYFQALGGAKDTTKGWRRWGTSITLGIFCALGSRSWIPLLCLATLHINSWGYGIPSFNGPNGTKDDDGSAIGSWWWYRLGGKEEKNDKIEARAGWMTRMTLAVIEGLTMLPLAWVALPWWVIGAGVLILLQPGVCWFVQRLRD